MNHSQPISLFHQFTNQIEKLNSKELHLSAKKAAKQEQRETLWVMAHLYEVSKRRLYAELGYSSLWAYAVNELGYASSSASERCEAMRLMYSSPLAIEKIESGELNLTNALYLQRYFNNLKTKPTPVEKESLIKSACGKSARELNAELLKLDPHSVPKKEKIKPLTPEFTELRFVIDEETIKMLERVKELKGSQTKLQEIFKLTLKHYLEKNDPLLKANKAAAKSTPEEKSAAPKSTPANETSTPEKNPTPQKSPSQKITRTPERSNIHSRYKPVDIKDAIQIRAQGQCEHITENGKRCECRTRLEYDHIIPFAMNGKTTWENLRLVCPAHNKYYAIRAFGREKMSEYFNI